MSDQDKVRVLIEVAGRSVVGEDGKVYPGESLEVDRADADIGDGFALDSNGRSSCRDSAIQGRQTIKMVSRQESVTQQPAATSRALDRADQPISRDQ